jgi:hypothetical protein
MILAGLYLLVATIDKKNTGKPVLATTSEQRPPVYNDQPDPQFTKN